MKISYWVCFLTLWTFQYCLISTAIILFLVSGEMFVYDFTMSNLVSVFPHALRHRIREKRIDGISFLIWQNFSASCIVRSTWILTEAMPWLSLISAFVSWSRLFKTAGRLSDTPILSRSSDIKKPRSAITLSFFPKVLHLANHYGKPLLEINPGDKFLISLYE